MNRLLNDAEQEMDEMLAGYLAGYPESYCLWACITTILSYSQNQQNMLQ